MRWERVSLKTERANPEFAANVDGAVEGGREGEDEKSISQNDIRRTSSVVLKRKCEFRGKSNLHVENSRLLSDQTTSKSRPPQLSKIWIPTSLIK